MGEQEAARHAQVHDQDRPIAEVNDDVLSPPVDDFDYAPRELGAKIVHWLAKNVRMKDLDMFDGSAGKEGAQTPDDGLDFGQLGHNTNDP